MVENNCTKLPKNNVIAVDDKYWIREYVKIGKLLGKKTFAIIGPNDNISQIMIDEIISQGLTWHPDCHISDLKSIPKNYIKRSNRIRLLRSFFLWDCSSSMV